MKSRYYFKIAYTNLLKRKRIRFDIFLFWISFMILFIANCLLVSFYQYTDKHVFNTFGYRTLNIKLSKDDFKTKQKIKNLLINNNDVIDIYEDSGNQGGTVINPRDLFHNEAHLSIALGHKGIERLIVSGKHFEENDTKVGIIPKYFYPDDIDTSKLKQQAIKYLNGDNFIGKTITIRYFAHDFLQDIEPKPIKSFYYTFEVVGTYDNLVNGEGPNHIYIPKDDIRLVNNNIDMYSIGIGENEIKTMKVIIKDSSKIDDLKLYLDKNMIDTERQVYLDKSYFIIKYMLRIISLIGLIFCFFSLLSIYLSTYNSVINRKKEIGTLKSLGYSSKIISKIIMLESMVIGWIGYFSSLIIFIIILMICNYYISKNLSIYYNSFQLSFNISIFFLIFIGGTIMSIVSSMKAKNSVEKISTL
ncbi:ABC transporter permease [Clostridiisalibacter paucivorans]|uniref:ABC transporter permease n=1 Tax=Clostridiisalibacter paucivorans TaxID=408753 RepID=UPI00047D3237|nr:ABC transporter permease [Clostridiisalibacter paucivorans]